MINKTFFLVAVGIIGFLVAFAFFGSAQAVDPFDITYPIVELGNCTSQQECKVFCDNSVNQKTCFNWAANQGFVSEHEVNRVRDMEKFQDGSAPIDDFGPGGCKTPRECDMFCRVPENTETCLQHSVDHGYMSQEEAGRIRIQSNKKGPGGCDLRESCDSFCRNPDNANICMQFVVDEGKITQKEADFLIEQSKMHEKFRERGSGGPGGSGPGPRPDDDFDEEKARELLKGMGGPGGCSTFDECDVFCSTPENDDICMAFAIEHGLIPPEKVERMKKMKEIDGPGGCNGPEECDAFCSTPGNGEICMQFSIDNDLIPPEEVERMKKEMEIIKKLNADNGGPGGCRGPQECDNFCRNPENTEECMNFGSKHGMINKDRVDVMLRQKHETERRMEFMDDKYSEDFKRMGPLPGFMPPPFGEQGPPSGFEYGEKEGFAPPPFGEMGPPPGFEDKEWGPPPGYQGEGPSKDNFMPGEKNDGYFTRPNGIIPSLDNDFMTTFEEKFEGDFQDYDQFREGVIDEGFRNEGFNQEFEGYNESFKQEFDQEFKEVFNQWENEPRHIEGGEFIPGSETYPIPSVDSFIHEEYIPSAESTYDSEFIPDFIPGSETYPMPPVDGFIMPSEEFKPMDSNYQQDQNFMPEPMHMPIEGEPSSYIQPRSIIGTIFGPFLDILQ